MGLYRQSRLKTTSFLLVFVFAIAAMSGASPASSSPGAGAPLKSSWLCYKSGAPRYRQGDVLVKFKRSVGTLKRKVLAKAAGAVSITREIGPLGGKDTLLVHLAPGASVEEAVKRFRSRPEVVFAEPNYLAQTAYTPSDPGFPQQWGLHNTGQEIGGVKGKPGADIQAERAWDIEQGLTNPVTVAVIDSGIDFSHPDLKSKIWTNEDEIPGNGIDDDHNGYVDDVHGYNWAGITQSLFVDIWSGSGQPWYRDFGTAANTKIFAQSITGTGCRLTDVGVMLSKSGNPTGDIKVSARERLDGPDIGSFMISPSEVMVLSDLKYKELSTSLKLEEGVTYYLVFSTTNEDPANYYRIYERQGYTDNYREGHEYSWDGSTWNSNPDDDFYFKTNPNSCPHDDSWHGTSVSGVVGAEPNDRGTAGVSFGAKIMPLKVLDSSTLNADIDAAGVSEAIYYAADNGANVVNMSFFGFNKSSTEQDAINYAHEKGLVMFAAVGNSGDNTVYYPAGCDYVVGVGATNNLDEKAYFSCANGSVDVSAPGQDVYAISTTEPSGYSIISGTSIATPHASGLAALILSAKPSYTPVQVEQVIETYADDRGPTGRDDGFGCGRINAYRALKAILTPRIDSLSSSSGPAASELEITGVNFRAAQGTSYVKFNTTKASTTDYISWSDSQIKVKVPAGATTGQVTVTTAAGTSNRKTFTVTAPQPAETSTWYLAEGSTSWGFNTYITIENPNASAVNARVTYMPTGAANKTETITLPPSSQTTLTGDHLVSVMGGQADFSTMIACEDPARSIAVDRTMTWTGPGASSPEAHSSIGVTSPAKAWYLPEGSSKWGFECWLLIQNPNPAKANVTLNYMIEGEGLKSVSHQVDPNSRATFEMSKDIGNKDASVQVASDLPVICERAMYRNNRREGHCSIGTTTPAKDFYLAEGTTDYGFTTYVLVQNPNNSPTDVTITYMTPEGPVPTAPFTMPANSRKTIRVNDVGEVAKTDLSTQVHGTLPIIAERAMYWGADTPLGEACHDSIGMASAHTSFYLPDGETSEDRETYTLVQNPNSVPISVEITYMTPTGADNKTFQDTVPANSRRTYNMADIGIKGRAATMVTSKTMGKKIIVERAMYWNHRGAGTDTIGGWSD